MKSKISFVCQECGYESSQWLGKCPECQAWNSLKEFKISNPKSQISNKFQTSENTKPKKLHEITYTQKERLLTGFAEADMVFGGGIVAGSVTLLAGDPGIGKSTLLLQMGLNISSSLMVHSSSPKKGSAINNEQSTMNKVLYISGEESTEQIKLRAERILGNNKRTQNDSFLLLSVNNTDAAIQTIEEEKPDFVIVDSIQTMESEAGGGMAGSVSQIRYASSNFIRCAKTLNIPIVMVGHVTKEGMVAGPMVLSHMVDTVLFFEGEKSSNTRILRSLKNRFGPVDEVGVFAMEGNGITEVQNPEQLFLTENTKEVAGAVLTVTMEGTRAFMVEIQGLVVYSKLPTPRRVVSGIDGRRVELLLAVLQKHCNVPVHNMDVFVNVAGGLKVTDRAVDLAVCLAIYSSFKNVPMSKTVAISEVGLLGELRKVGGSDKRMKEAKKLGFKKILDASKGSIREVVKGLT